MNMKANQNNHVIYLAIADDDKLQRFILNSLIRKDSRFKLLFDATDGQDFVGKLKLCAILPDVCIIDLKMPTMGGIETTAYIKKYNSAIKVIGYTSSNDLTEISLMKESGADDIVKKSSVYGLLDHILETCAAV